jgi:hypothetical protein
MFLSRVFQRPNHIRVEAAFDKLLDGAERSWLQRLLIHTAKNLSLSDSLRLSFGHLLCIRDSLISADANYFSVLINCIFSKCHVPSISLPVDVALLLSSASSHSDFS